MSNAVWFISYKLVKGSSTEEFLQVSETLFDKVISPKKGFIYWKQLVEGDTWVDFTEWETMEDAKNFEANSDPNDPFAAKFYSFIDFDSLKSNFYTVKKSY